MALWAVLALFASVLSSTGATVHKKILQKEHAMEFSAIFALTNALLALILIPWVDFGLGWKFILIIYLVSWLGTLGLLFVAKAIRHMELSSAMPLTNFAPAFVALLSIFFLGEFLGGFQWVGIGFLLVGGYFLETRHFKDYKLFFYNLKRSKGIHYMLLGLVIYSFNAVADRYVLTNITDFITFLFFLSIFLAFNFFVLSSYFHNGVHDFKHGIKKQWKWFIFGSVVAFGSAIIQLWAVSLISVALVLSVKRLNVLFTVIFGGELFHEKHLKKKIIATVIMLMGVALILI